jgi:hypothetical protein
MSHYILSEEQVNNVLKAIQVQQVLIDLACAANPNTAVSIDADALATVLSLTRDLLPDECSMQFVGGR